MPRKRQARPCGAHRKRDGAPCGCWAMIGATTCRLHGGAAPQVRRAARRRIEDERARRVLARVRALVGSFP